MESDCCATMLQNPPIITMRGLQNREGGSRRGFSRDNSGFAKTQAYLVVFFGLLFVFTCVCCGKRAASRNRLGSEGPDDDDVTPEEEKERRIEQIKKGLKTKKWSRPTTNERNDKEQQPQQQRRPSTDDNSVTGSSTFMTTSRRITSALQNTASNSFLVKSISKIALSEEEEQQLGEEQHSKDVCTICLNEFTEEDIVGYSTHPDCSHEYHEECITSWLMKHKDCPLCRNDFLEELEDIEQQQQALENSEVNETLEVPTRETDSGDQEQR